MGCTLRIEENKQRRVELKKKKKINQINQDRKRQ